jgi:hypothetical protein
MDEVRGERVRALGIAGEREKNWMVWRQLSARAIGLKL